MEENEIVLVDENDNEIGFETKKNCHYIEPKLHRAFSVFLFNEDGKLILTKRSDKKNTWPGFWTNSCCSHPNKNETVEDAIKRKLKQELNIECDLNFAFKFQYSAMYDDLWGENEIDWVYIGKYDGELIPNQEEIQDIKVVSREELKPDMEKNPQHYTPWFKISLNRVLGFVDGKEKHPF